MKCLIPVHQEMYPENSLNRAEKICDEVTVLYIVDRKLMEKVQSEASYILPSYALDNVENFIVDIHKQEAERIKRRINVPVTLEFIVGEYYEIIEKEILRNSPDIFMSDFYQRVFLRMNVPVWIDRGSEIRNCTLVVNSLKRIKKIKHAIEFTKYMCKKLESTLLIYYPPMDDEGIKALRPMGEIVSELRGELLVFIKEDMKKLPSNANILLL